MLTVLSPRAHRLRVGREVTPLAALDGVTLGLLSNSKPNATFLLDLVAERIASRVDLAGIVRTSKLVPSSPAPEDVYTELERECGAVIFASAD